MSRPSGSIVDVVGVRVGHAQDVRSRTGCTVVLMPEGGVVCGVDVRGSAPGAVTAELHARGLPNAPSASIAANGTLDGSPLDVAATLARAGRSGLRAKIERGAWKSVIIRQA